MIQRAACFLGESQIGEIGRVSLIAQSGKARTLLAPTPGKGTKILVGSKRGHVGVLHGEEYFEFLADLGFVFRGNSIEHLPFEMHNAELVQCRGKMNDVLQLVICRVSISYLFLRRILSCRGLNEFFMFLRIPTD